jgi:arylsulfatase A-like enzyme
VNGQSPNILLIHCHDLGRFLGCYGVPTVRTPHLDALAADGVRFERAFCVAPQCSPSRAALFTGRYPHSTGVMGLTTGAHAWDLYPEEEHLGQVLLANGYETVLVGVQHEARATSPEQVAARCGMDVVVPGGRGEGVSERTLAQLARLARGERPFYLQVGYVEPHRLHSATRAEPDYLGFLGDYLAPDDEVGGTIPPYLCDEPRAREELAELQGAVRYVDAAIGRVLAGLRDLGLEENTLVLVTTDHGLALPRAKCGLYDPGLETALLARWPARGWRGGRVCAELIPNVDIFPTLLEAAGIPVGERVQGRSFLALLDGAAYQPRDCIFGEFTYHRYYDPRRCVRTAEHKLILNFSAAPASMDPSQSWRPRTTPVVPLMDAAGTHPIVELYDLRADPLELHNLTGHPAYASVRRDLLDHLYVWMRATGDPLLRGAVPAPMHHWALAELTGEDARAAVGSGV